MNVNMNIKSRNNSRLEAVELTMEVQGTPRVVWPPTTKAVARAGVLRKALLILSEIAAPSTHRMFLIFDIFRLNRQVGAWRAQITCTRLNLSIFKDGGSIKKVKRLTCAFLRVRVSTDYEVIGCKTESYIVRGYLVRAVDIRPGVRTQLS